MALNTSTATSVAAGSRRRLDGPDVVRAVALIGVVVMNYHGYLVLRGGRIGSGWAADLFDPWDGPLATRFAATFVLVAGVGVTLLTRRSLASADRITEMRWRLVRRGLLLYAGGLFLDVIWAGTIIPYYGAMFVIAAGMFTLRSRWIVAIGAAAVVAGAGINLWVYRRGTDGDPVSWLTTPSEGSVSDLVFGVLVNGTHPLLPWFGYFCAGMVLARIFDHVWWRAAAVGVGFVLYATATIVASTARTDFRRFVFSEDPSSRSLVYVASALGTALLAYAVIDAIAERFSDATDPLRRAGQLSLSLYLLHIVVFNFVVDWMGWVEPAGLATSLVFALVFWVVAITMGSTWHRRYGRGPAERVYRAIGG